MAGSASTYGVQVGWAGSWCGACPGHVGAFDRTGVLASCVLDRTGVLASCVLDRTGVLASCVLEPGGALPCVCWSRVARLASCVLEPGGALGLVCALAGSRSDPQVRPALADAWPEVCPSLGRCPGLRRVLARRCLRPRATASLAALVARRDRWPASPALLRRLRWGEGNAASPSSGLTADAHPGPVVDASWWRGRRADERSGDERVAVRPALQPAVSRPPAGPPPVSPPRGPCYRRHWSAMPTAPSAAPAREAEHTVGHQWDEDECMHHHRAPRPPRPRVLGVRPAPSQLRACARA